MTHAATIATLLALAASAATAHAQDVQDGARHDEAQTLERRTLRLLRDSGPSVLSVHVVTRAAQLPRLVLPGVTLAPPGGPAERVDASGFLATREGHVVTTAAALRDAALVEIRFADGTVRDADVVGIDGPFRIAVLRTRAPDSVEPLSVPDRSDVAVTALGWFFQAAGERPDVQLAMVRAADARATPYDRYLYTALPLVPGAAGGPLLAADGRLMGMAVCEVARPAAGGDDHTPPVVRTTLFVRGDDVHGAVRDIVRFGRVRRPMLGVVMQRDTNRIDQLLPGGPAEAAGFAEGDRLVSISGTPIASLPDLTRTLLRRRIGDTVMVGLERDGVVLERPVRLADVPLPALPDAAPIPGVVLQIAAAPDADGVRAVTVTHVDDDSPAAAAGLRVGDRLVAVDGRPTLDFLGRHSVRPAAGAPSVLAVQRGDERVELQLRPAAPAHDDGAAHDSDR